MISSIWSHIYDIQEVESKASADHARALYVQILFGTVQIRIDRKVQGNSPALLEVA